MRPGRAALLLSLVAAAAGFAETRPLRTEEATTAPSSTLLLESGLDFIAREPDYITGVPRQRWDGPLLRVVYSPADPVELDLEWVVRVAARADAPGEDASDWGDVSLRAKFRFVDGGRRRPTLGARFGVTLPETSFSQKGQVLGLGPNTLRAFAEALLSLPLGRAALHLNAGLLIHDKVLLPHEQRDFTSYAFALTWPVSRRLELVSEVAGRAGASSAGSEPRSELRVGARFGSGRVRGDAAMRRGLARADGSWGATLGLRFWIAEAKPAS